MKKVIIVLAVVLMAALPVVAKSSQVGLEAGMVSGITYRTEIENKFNFTATAGVYGFNSASAAAGVLWEQDAVKIESLSFTHQFGGQVEVGYSASGIYVSPMLLAEVDYAFNWINNAEFTAFLRLGYGPSFAFTEDGLALGWAHFNASIGLVHEI